MKTGCDLDLWYLRVPWQARHRHSRNYFTYRYGERGGSVVECRTPEREVRGSRPTAAVLCPWARHFTPRKYWLITQEAMAPSRHDWKIVDWDVKPQHNQPTYRYCMSDYKSSWGRRSCRPYWTNPTSSWYSLLGSCPVASSAVGLLSYSCKMHRLYFSSAFKAGLAGTDDFLHTCNTWLWTTLVYWQLSLYVFLQYRIVSQNFIWCSTHSHKIYKEMTASTSKTSNISEMVQLTSTERP